MAVKSLDTDATLIIKAGDIFNIAVGELHALRATTPLTFIEVQQGTNLVEDDIERFDYEW